MFEAVVLAAAVFDAAVFEAAVFNAAVFNAAVLAVAVFAAAVFAAAVLDAAVLDPAVFDAAVLDAAMFEVAAVDTVVFAAAATATAVAARAVATGAVETGGDAGEAAAVAAGAAPVGAAWAARTDGGATAGDGFDVCVVGSLVFDFGGRLVRTSAGTDSLDARASRLPASGPFDSCANRATAGFDRADGAAAEAVLVDGPVDESPADTAVPAAFATGARELVSARVSSDAEAPPTRDPASAPLDGAGQ